MSSNLGTLFHTFSEFWVTNNFNVTNSFKKLTETKRELLKNIASYKRKLLIKSTVTDFTIFRKNYHFTYISKIICNLLGIICNLIEW